MINKLHKINEGELWQDVNKSFHNPVLYHSKKIQVNREMPSLFPSMPPDTL